MKVSSDYWHVGHSKIQPTGFHQSDTFLRTSLKPMSHFCQYFGYLHFTINSSIIHPSTGSQGQQTLRCSQASRELFPFFEGAFLVQACLELFLKSDRRGRDTKSSVVRAKCVVLRSASLYVGML